MVRMYIWPRYVLKANGRRIRFTKSCKFALALARLVAADGGMVTHKELIEAAYYGDEDGGADYAVQCLRVAVMRFRRVLRKVDLDIENVFDRGYRLVTREKAKAATLVE